MSIQIRNLCKSFQDNQVLRSVNLDVREKEIVVLMGLSGSGKTTLLRCLCDLETADSGEIRINDRYLLKEENGKRVYADKETKKALRKEVGMVFQNYQLFPHRDVLQNLIEAPVYHKLMSKEEATQKAEELLTRLQIQDKLHAYPSTLSGGQKQRVAIARACMLQPSILCFDEPTSALDVESIASVTSIIKDLSKEMAILIITHDEGFAERVGTRVVRITDINQ
ncbi:amino acid ABC transporter ATP-binding protein [[Clostridium] innocuum]|nr:amino acid ABC transporter ATP-binding protein [[Clostridium] innocuum]MCR0577963.1 amino acid ABC transporter ATP-binding protein [[Clostridium] innocuum]